MSIDNEQGPVAAPREGPPPWYKHAWENFGVSAAVSLFVSAVVSALAITFFEARLENSKNRVEMIIHQKDQFDNAQMKVLTEIGLYTARVFNHKDVTNREAIEGAIIAAQLQTNSLSEEVGPSEQKLLAQYGDDLEVLRTKIQAVKAPDDLGPVFVAAQTMLKKRDEVGEKVREKLNISVF
jgi:hypothetical protein